MSYDLAELVWKISEKGKMFGKTLCKGFSPTVTAA